MPEPEEIWEALTRPSAGLSGRPHPAARDVWLGLDPEDHRHLMVRAASAEAGEVLLTTRGLRASLTKLSLEGEPEGVWVDVACLEPSLNRTFVTVANDLAEAVESSDGDLLDAVRSVLRTWRWFWQVDPNELSAEAAVGLFGELWFMDRWAPFPDAITTWIGPTGYRHDFASSEVSVEVKATRLRLDGAARHRIANLDQLEAPETGRLLLFSLQVVADPNAANTLPGIIARLRRRLIDRPDLTGLVDQRLAQAGWSPAGTTQHSQPWRVIAEELYRVEGDFPRLTRLTFPDGIPTGVDEIGYTLDLAACRPWRIASRPAEAGSVLSALRR